MQRHLLIPFLLITPFAATSETSAVQTNNKEQYEECVGVSLHTMQGRELNSIVENNRMIKDSNVIPKGWTVVGTTTKTETDVTTPYLVICH